MTQDPEHSEIAAHGLRLLDVIGSHSQNDAFSYRSVLSQGQTNDCIEPASSIFKREFKEDEIGAVDSATAVMSNTRARKEAHFDRSRLRSWRMSEPFSLLLQHQLKALVNAHLTPEPPSFACVGRLKTFASTLWTNYLGVTGELGGDMWALAFRRVLTAIEVMLESRKSHILLCNSEGRSCVNYLLPRVNRKGDKNSPHLMRIIMSKLGPGFYWIGWSSLYCPNESENANNPFFLFETDCGKENQELLNYLDDDASSVTLGTSDSDTEDEVPPDKRLCRDPTLSGQNTTEQEPLVLSNDVQKLSKLWKEMLVENLIKRQPKREMFWHGQLGHYRSNLLLEYNLGVLFISALLALTVVNTEEIPICRHDFFTLHDLSCLCRDRENFPYLLADRWVSPHFVSYNANTQNSFRRPMAPDLSLLVRVTIQLITMLGITERPRLPLCSMVHRFLRMMAFPLEAHQMADSLIVKLARCVTENAAEKNMGMHYFLPLSRYLRGEVFAMAIVAVTGRMLFKLDGDFELHWSNVARFLTKHPQKANILEEVLNDGGTQTDARGRTVPFDWSSWVCGLPNGAPSLRRSRSRFRDGDAPLSTVLTYSQLVQTAKSAEGFLGAASSFDPLVDEGWGEKHNNARRHASKETKLDLTDPLTQLIGLSHFTTCDDNVQTNQQNATITPTPCKSCIHNANHSIFKRVSCDIGCRTWMDSNCDCIVRAHKYIRRKKIAASKLLTRIGVLKLESNDVYDDWLHILENFDSYNPISRIDFSVDFDEAQTSTKFPPPVIEFIEDHEKRLFKFLSGNKFDSDPRIGKVSAHQGSAKGNVYRANASLHWFLRTAGFMCGARLPELLTEIECVEHLLGYDSNKSLNIQTKLRNLSLAFHFDYTVTR